MGFKLVTLFNDSGLMATYAQDADRADPKEFGGKA